ncbi:MAG: hypothetical protein J6C96_08045 [Oscillospiraceae bacterium]|nr:hypothetical protein [Oscillospiraceae bacterium]
MRNEELAKKAYEIISETASSNIVIQGLSGVLGFPFTIMADGAVIFTHYGAMLNRLRSLYGRTPVSEEVLIPIVKGISNELLFDVVADKVLGNVPIVGIYFNMICAKTMTWRLGILFTMLSARGEDMGEKSVADTTKLIRLVFPQTDTFKFQQPSYATFLKLVNSISDNSMEQFDKKITKALSAFDD